MARVFSEAAWKSDKIFNIQPVEWRAEYAWLYSIALADGTFEASPRLVWMAAYASVRPDWEVDRIVRLMDELERVGLLQRTQDEQGKVWGWWVGSEKFLPTPERCETKRYKTGRRDLFKVSDGAAPPQHRGSPAKVLDLVLVSEMDKEKGVVVAAPKDSENEQPPEQVKSFGVSLSLTPTPAPTPTPKPTATPKREVLPPDEYRRAKAAPELERSIAEFAAEIAGREPCPVCAARHPLPFCKEKK